MSIALSGSLVITGSIFATQGITGSFSGSATSASYAETLQGLGSASFAPAATFNTVSQSYATTSGSLSTRVTNLESTSSTVSSSFVSTSGSIAGRVTLIEGQYATTGSNTFTGNQYISNTSNPLTFTTTASLYTDGGLRVSKDSFISGTAYFNNVVVYGTSSIQYITSSQINVGANIINLNTQLPAQRFGGMAVADSGSNGATGSMLWDSVNNGWIYTRESGSTYVGGALISGPRNTGSIGNEQSTTACALMMGQGGDHITSSAILHYGNATCFYGNALFVSSSCNVGIGTSAPNYTTAGRTVLALDGSTSTIYAMQNSGTSAGYIYGDASSVVLWAEGTRNLTAGVASSGCVLLTTNNTTRLTISPVGNATFTCNITAGGRVYGTTTGLSSDFNSGGLIAYSCGSTLKYTQVGFDCNSNYGWIQSLHQGTSYTNLVINQAGGNLGIGTITPASLLSAYNITSTAISQMYISNPASNGTGGGNRGFDLSFTSTTTSFTGTDNTDQGYGYFPIAFVSGQTYTIHFKSVAVNGSLGTIITSTGTNFATDTVQTITLPTITDGALTSIRFTATGAASYLGFAGYRTSGTMSLTISELSVVNGIPDTETGAIVAYKGVATNRINIQAPTTSCIPVLGCADCTTGLVVSNFDTRYGMLLGTLNTGAGWIQQGRYDGTATAYSLLLNPNGGNVGIGTTTPTSKLTVLKTITTCPGATGNAALSLGTAGSAGEYNLINFGYDSESWQPAYFGYLTTSGAGSSNGALVFGTREATTNSQPTERMRINCTGNVGIGTTNLSTEANLFLGNQGSGAANEGGQLVLQKGYSCQCATHLDNYANQFRIMSGTDTATATVNMSINHTTGNPTFASKIVRMNDGYLVTCSGALYASCTGTIMRFFDTTGNLSGQNMIFGTLGIFAGSNAGYQYGTNSLLYYMGAQSAGTTGAYLNQLSSNNYSTCMIQCVYLAADTTGVQVKVVTTSGVPVYGVALYAVFTGNYF